MPKSQSNQLETILDEVPPNIQALNVFINRDFFGHTSIQCSQQFLNKLEKFINKSLDQSNYQAASLGFTVLHKCGKSLKLPGGQGLSALIAQGLLEKMWQWFEKCSQLWILVGCQRDDNLLNLAEDYFDALMEGHESCSTGAIKVTETFLFPLGHLIVDPRISILIQKEAIRKFNLILEKCPMELKKNGKILRSQEAADIMLKLARKILEGGDYDFETALMEALCRMASSELRKQLANRWFTMQHVSTAFVKIRDTEFETDCRKFLNMVNGMKGDKRSVFSYPCLEVYLGKTELFMPVDENLEEFWIDFNIGSRSISFYISLPGEEAQEGQWETLCISENEIQTYSVTETGKMKVLKLDLSELVVLGSVEGSILTIHFSSGLDILSVVQRLFGHNKNTGFVGKTGPSVVKTTVKIIMDENSSTSQIVPESQMSLGENEKNVGLCSLLSPTAPVQIRTPANMRMSESATYISSSGGGSSKSVSAVLPSVKCKGKPSLEMVRSVETAKTRQSTTPSTARGDSTREQSKAFKKNESDKYKKNSALTKADGMVLAKPSDDELSMGSTVVPDSQPTDKRDMSSNSHKCSVSDMLMRRKEKMCSRTIFDSPPSSAQKQVCPSSAQRMSAPSSGSINPQQLHAELTQRLQKVLNERNQAASPKEAPAPKRKMPETNQELKIRRTAGQIDPQVCDPKEKTQRTSKTKAKDKVKTQVKPKAVQVKTQGKAAVESTAPADTTTTLSSKEKRDAEVTSNMVKHISSHYEAKSQIIGKGMVSDIPPSWIPPFTNRPFFNMKWHTAMGKTSSLIKTYNKPITPSAKQRQDVFAFNAETPQSIGKNKTLMSTACTSLTDESSALPSSKKKEQPPPKAKRHVKKHLFSDTDHDTTDVSWLRESSRKSKPKVTKYSKQAPDNPKGVSAITSSETSYLPPPSAKQAKANTKSLKEPKKDAVKKQQKTVKAASAVNKPPAAGRRSSRAAANTPKNYREIESDGSQSEFELFKVGENEKTHEIQKRNMKNNPVSQSYLEPENPNSSQSESELKEPHTSEINSLDEWKNEGVKTSSKLEQASNKRVAHTNQAALKKPPEKQKPGNDLSGRAQKTKKPTKKNAASVKEQTATLKESWAVRQASLSPPPPFIERMRSAERSGPTLDLTYSTVSSPRGSPLAVSPIAFGSDPITPILLLPKPRSRVSSTGDFKTSSLDSRNKKPSTSKTQSIKSVNSLPSLTPKGHSKPCGPIKPCVIESPVQQHLSSPQSPLFVSQPLMTSTLVNQDNADIPSLPQSPFPEVNSSQGSNPGLSRISSVSQVSLSLNTSAKSSVTGKEKDDITADDLSVAQRVEITPQIDQSFNSAEDLVSGPNRKRHISCSSSSNSDEEEKKQKKKSKMRTQHSSRMKPRKLFKSASKSCDQTNSWQDQSGTGETNKEGKTGLTKTLPEESVSAKKKKHKRVIAEDTVTEVSAEGGVSQVQSSSHTGNSGHWETDEDFNSSEINPRDMCRQFSCELKKKFKTRCKIVEVYNKQSLNTVQQHISTINSQVTKHRTQKMEHVRKVLLEEIHKLEQDETALKNMENDLTMYWNKQTVALHSLQKQEKTRNELLKKTLQNNVSHLVEYEERVFTSQMGLIRKDMKSVHDRLVNEMQEGEIQSVKRGLHALFFPDATRF